jgi:hypothetical protein
VHFVGALNATLEGVGAIFGALIIGFFVLDGLPYRRRTRGFIGLAFVTITTIVVWSCALAWQVNFTRTPRTKMHYTDSGYHAKGALYFFCACRPHFDNAIILTYRTSLFRRRVLPGARVLDHGRHIERPVHPRALHGLLQSDTVCGGRRLVRDGRYLDAVLE